MAVHIATLLFTAFIIYIASPGSSLFSWHPTLMTLAFVGGMFQGLLVFNRESSMFLNASKTTKVLVHQCLHIFAVLAAISGFGVIYYNKDISNKPHFTTWHGLFGVISVIFITCQAFGGDVLKYEWLRSVLKIRKSVNDLKIYHATSGLVGFTIVMTTLMLALYSNWFTSQVNDVLWYVCQLALSFIAVVIMNQVVSEYLPRTGKPPKSVEHNEGSSKKQ